ncbi:MAG TPA: patatin-like phospholipase family protein [Methylomusa anaerophila]|uniref:NTE family protein RssA n=1 Tax=Methylomusa anaerophila TaxID=1930071 RepID=A0A348APT0_9FIRM|nr:patatin-like phospholipase family protein [Methylomusa anaerophila]BBB93078.1 NTE family protein RssA [Methylomusa anaerophila]HML87089.1 patatin-like phospholipase family protein [Methylomusa anaerophila]
MIITINNHKRQAHRKKIGVALSGGSIRGSAHIGVLQALNDHNIPVDFIAGSSAGAIVASLYACGYSPIQMKKLLQSLQVQELIDLKVTTADLFKHGLKWMLSGKVHFWSVFPTGLIKGEKIERYLADLLQQRTIRDTKIPLAITAVDIISGDTVFFTSPLPNNRTILNARYYHNALLYEAIRASISIPGIFFPKKYRNMALVDGGVKNNLPTDILKYMGADVIIGVDLGYNGQQNYEIEKMGEVLLRCIEIMGREVTLLKGQQYADIMIRPQTIEVSFKDMKQALNCIYHGELATLEKIPEIKKLL